MGNDWTAAHSQHSSLSVDQTIIRKLTERRLVLRGSCVFDRAHDVLWAGQRIDREAKSRHTGDMWASAARAGKAGRVASVVRRRVNANARRRNIHPRTVIAETRFVQAAVDGCDRQHMLVAAWIVRIDRGRVAGCSNW